MEDEVKTISDETSIEELRKKSKELYKWFTDNFNFTYSIKIDFDGVSLEQRVAFVPNDYINDRSIKTLEVKENQTNWQPTPKGVAKWAAINSGLLNTEEAEKGSEKFNAFWDLFSKYLFRAN